MKKSIKFFTLVSCIMIFSFSILSGCGLFTIKDTRYVNPWAIKEEENGWYYYISKRTDVENYEEHAVILGLVDEEMDCDELVVPEKLGGHIVKYFGSSYTQMAAPTKYYKFNAKNVRSLIFNHNIRLMPSVFDDYYGTVIINCDLSETNFLGTKLILNLNYIRYNGMGGEVTTHALFWHIDRQIPKPEDPIRDGYVFDGWYTDDGYTIEWDFDNYLIQGNMTLYAKWLEQ